MRSRRRTRFGRAWGLVWDAVVKKIKAVGTQRKENLPGRRRQERHPEEGETQSALKGRRQEGEDLHGGRSAEHGSHSSTRQRG